MDLLFWLYVLLMILICAYHLKNVSSTWHIPGPRSVPLMGSFASLVRTAINEGKNALSEPLFPVSVLCKQYGNVMSLGLGSDQWVVLSGLEEIKAFGMKTEAMARPPMPDLNQLYCFNKEGSGVIFAHGALWRDQRKFMAKTLKEMTSGDKPFAEQILDEYTLFSHHIKKSVGQNPIFEGKTFFDIATLNIIWRLATAHRFEYDDKATQETIAHVEAFTMENTLGLIGSVSYAKYLPPFSGIYNSIERHMIHFKKQLQSYMSQSHCSMDLNYVQRFQEEQIKDGVKFSDAQLITSLFDFFTGGSGTMSKTLSFCILYMLHFPEMQNKIRAEAESICHQNNGEISKDNEQDMPWTMAFIYEVQRLSSILPICPPRMVTSDIEIGGYKLYKGQRVQMNLFAMHRNEQHWGSDAHLFRPDRFIDGHTGQVKQDEWLQPFGYGKRKCLGEAVAKSTIFVILANLVKEFKFTALDSGLPDTDPVGGLTLMPKDFKVQVTVLSQ